MTTAEMSLIANFEMARGISNHVAGMEKFLSHFMQTLPPTDRQLCIRYWKARDAELDNFLAKAKKNGWGVPEPKKSKVPCAACDRGDFQWGHHIDCPKANQI